MNFKRGDTIFAFFLVFLLVGLSFLFISKASSQGNASLYFSPSNGKKSVGETFAVAVRVNTAGNSINATEGSVVFASDKLQVTSVSKAGSIFTLWATEPSFSNADGTVEFAGGIPNPGYSGSNGTVITINFKAKTATTVRGYTEIVMVSGAILANDGEGTNILASLGKAEFYISPTGIPIPSEPSSPTVTQPEAQGMVIKSNTHPDSGKWYSNNDPVFNWELADSVETVSYLVTDKPTSNPGTIPDGLVGDAKFNDIPDGVNYFHLRFRDGGNWGPINHFKFQVDTKSPKEFQILVEDDNTSEPKLTFESSDDLSGIDHYEIKIDKKDWVVIDKALAGKPYALNKISYGEHQVMINAVDMAGNTTTVSVGVTVPGGIWDIFKDKIMWIFRNWLFPAVIVAIIALAHEFFGHSKWWKKIKKNLKFKKEKKDNILDLRDIKK